MAESTGVPADVLLLAATIDASYSHSFDCSTNYPFIYCTCYICHLDITIFEGASALRH